MVQIDRADLINEFERITKKLGHCPSIAEWSRAGAKYSKKPYLNQWGSWNKLVIDMGYKPHNGDNRLQAPDLYIELYDRPPLLEAEKVLIAFDPHIPYHSVETINEMVEWNEKNLKAKTLVVGGDLIDFKGLYTKETQTTRIDWVQEMEEAVKVLEWLSGKFDTIYCIMGNHDWRIVRLLGNSDIAQRLYGLIFNNPRIKMSKYYYLIINGWLAVAHDANSKLKLSKLERVVNVHRMSMIVGHSHRFAMGVHDSGLEVMGEGLHLSDPSRHEYRGLNLRDFSTWIKGWWYMKDNAIAPYVMHERILK